ncbi:23S rRNA (pseudouridine(1915)-N(3))-methyltransferase RlmH [Oceanithermus sp.]
MRWRLAMVGKPKLPFASEGIELYLKRLRRWTSVEVVSVRGGGAADESSELERVTEGWFRILLDERGQQLRSTELARKIEGWETHGPQKLALLIGGAEGHTRELRERADWVWSLSPLTLQHEIALLVALEQIYRAYTITRGTPYHRE